MGAAGHAQAVAQVFEIKVVGNRFDLSQKAPPAAEQTLVLVVDMAAIAIGFRVVGQILSEQRAFACRQQVPKAGAELEAPFGQDARRERQIVIGCEVEVIGHLNIRAGALALAEIGYEQPALACLCNGKGNVGQRQDRNIFELELDAACRPKPFVHVQPDLIGQELPVCFVFRAGGIGHLIQFHHAIATDADFFC